MDLQKARRDRELRSIGKLSNRALIVFLQSYQSGNNSDYDLETGRVLNIEAQRRKLVA